MSSKCRIASGRAIRRAAFSALESLEQRRLFSAGDLDAAFGAGGLATTDFQGPTIDGAAKMIQVAGNKLIAIGRSDNTPVIARFNANGSPDATFGDNGSVKLNASTLTDISSVARDSSGNLIVAGSLNLQAAIVRLDADGNLDTGFGSGGVTTVAAAGASATDVAIDSFDRIVVSAAGTGDFATFRLDTQGTLDSNFAGTGLTTIDFGDNDSASTIAIDNAGRVVIAGETGPDGNTDLAVARLDANGAPDSGFGSGGILVTNVALPNSNNQSDHPSGIVVQGADDLILGGTAGENFFVMHLLANGDADANFGVQVGYTVTPIDNGIGGRDFGNSVATDSNGNIIMAGASDDVWAVAKYDSTGHLDSGFNGSGILTQSFSSPSGAASVIVKADDTLRVLGSVPGAEGDGDFGIEAYNADGTSDTSFGDNGLATEGFTGSSSETSHAVAQQSDDKLVAVGTTERVNGRDIALARYLADGSLDSSFGTGGRKVVRLTGSDDARAVTVSSTGKIFVAFTTGDGDFGVARFNSNGSLDTNFGSGGYRVLTTAGAVDEVQAIALSPDEASIYLFGKQDSGSDTDFELAKLSSSGTVTYGNDANPADTGLAGAFDGVAPGGMVVQSDGQIVVAGSASNGVDSDFATARLNPDGSLDSSFTDGVHTPGTVLTDLGFDLGTSVALDSAGNIYVGGYQLEAGGMSVVKYDSSGTRITSGFGDANGVAAIAIEDGALASSLAVASNGAITVSGNANNVNGQDIALTRFNSAGAVDSTFGGGAGFVTLTLGAFSQVNGMVIQSSDGNIVLAVQGDQADFQTARFEAGQVVVPPAPVAAAGSDLDVNEGGGLNFDGSNSTGAGLSYAWDLDGDGDFDDAFTALASHNYPDGDAQVTVSLQVTDSLNRTDVDTLTVTVHNVAPTLGVTGTGSASEGSLYSVNLSSSDPGGDTITGWSINWGDGHTDSISGNPSSASHTYADNGNYTVLSSATDEDGTFAAPNHAVSVSNIAPTASVTGPATLMPGLAGTFTLNAGDPSSADQAANFTFQIDWDGNGTVDQTIVAHSGTTVSHTFFATGGNTVKVKATDKDGAQSTAAGTLAVNVAAPASVTAQVLADPLNVGQTMLLVNGTAGADEIKLTVNNNHDTVSVRVSGVLIGTFSPTSRIVLFANNGDDEVTHGGGFKRAVELYGGNGADTLKAGQNGDILVGGAGDDSLVAGAGNDLLIGGTGSDKIVAGGGEDILVAGFSSFDNDPTALNKISDEWTSARSFQSRIANLIGNNPNAADYAARLNGNIFLLADVPNATVFDDGNKDTANGGGGSDWFFVNITGGVIDKTNGLNGSDVGTDIS